jgi:hypothetical protein
MKTYLIAAVYAASALFLLPQTTSAGPVTQVAHRTAHFANKAGQTLDRHLIKPARRVIVNHTPRPR